MTSMGLTPIVQDLHAKTSKAKNLILLDRDGTLNNDLGYTYKLSDLKLLYNNIEIIKNLTDKKSSIVCITNQSGIGRGLFSENDAKRFNFALSEKLSKLDLMIESFYICPHSPILECACRKPKTLMLELAMKRYNVSTEKSIYVGDSIVDQIASNQLGVKFIKVPKNEM
jgi:histidinol-phosphate phosphatase family protein